MIRREQLPELRIFARTEKEFQLRNDPAFATLVVPNGNGSAAGHRWFKYKEAFSSELLTNVLATLRADCIPHPIRMLDPYCGVGTSLLSAQLLDDQIESVGIECNPFSAFVARTKLSWHLMDAGKIRRLATRLLAQMSASKVALPRLSSITSGRCITRHMALQVMQFRLALEALPSSIERDALMLGLASVIEPVSRVRRDGRALRIVEKHRMVFREVLAARWSDIAADVEVLQNTRRKPGLAKICTGDGRQPATVGVANGSIDLIVTSPPYPNNIDYNEVYKLELWFLGYVKDAEEFLALRRSTFRSHPTCSPVASQEGDLDEKFQQLLDDGPLAELMGTVIRRVSRIEKTDRRGRSKVLLGYVHDTWDSLKAHYRTLRRGGRAIYVVGNSLHGGSETPYLVPTDLIFAKLAQDVGFKVQELIVARGLQRRLAGNHFLRDTIVVLRKG